jgi:hypothetical protein
MESAHQQREEQLLLSLKQCSSALERALQILAAHARPEEIPQDILDAASKYSTKNLEHVF